MASDVVWRLIYVSTARNRRYKNETNLSIPIFPRPYEVGEAQAGTSTLYGIPNRGFNILIRNTLNMRIGHKAGALRVVFDVRVNVRLLLAADSIILLPVNIILYRWCESRRCCSIVKDDKISTPIWSRSPEIGSLTSRTRKGRIVHHPACIYVEELTLSENIISRRICNSIVTRSEPILTPCSAPSDPLPMFRQPPTGVLYLPMVAFDLLLITHTRSRDRVFQ